MARRRLWLTFSLSLSLAFSPVMLPIFKRFYFWLPVCTCCIYMFLCMQCIHNPACYRRIWISLRLEHRTLLKWLGLFNIFAENWILNLFFLWVYVYLSVHLRFLCDRITSCFLVAECRHEIWELNSRGTQIVIERGLEYDELIRNNRLTSTIYPTYNYIPWTQCTLRLPNAQVFYSRKLSKLLKRYTISKYNYIHG